MKDKIQKLIIVLVCLIVGAGIAVYVQTKAGSLTPPGTPAPTMKTLSEISGGGGITGGCDCYYAPGSTSCSLIAWGLGCGAGGVQKNCYNIAASGYSCGNVGDDEVSWQPGAHYQYCLCVKL